MEIKKTLKIFLAIFLSFFFAKITGQLDLITLAHLGHLEMAAFSLPGRVMFLDTVAAFAIGPVLAVFIERDSDHALATRKALTIGLFVGIITAAINLILCPLLINLISPNESINYLGNIGVFWLTFSVPIRMVSFIGSMSLYGRGAGKYVVCINACEFFVRICLNILFVLGPLNLGFMGVFISGIISSFVNFFLTYFLLVKEVNSWLLLSIPDWKWFSQIFHQSKYEGAKVGIERAIIFLGVAFFAMKSTSSNYLAVYSCAAELQIVFSVFSISLMRALAISLASQQERGVILREDRALWKLFIYLLMIAFFLSSILLAFYHSLGISLYGFTAASMAWWESFAVLFAISIPLQVCEGFLRSLWQARGLFQIPAILSIIYEILIYAPTTYLGIQFDAPWVAWSPMIIGPIINCTALYKLGLKYDLENQQATKQVLRS